MPLDFRTSDSFKSRSYEDDCRNELAHRCCLSAAKSVPAIAESGSLDRLGVVTPPYKRSRGPTRPEAAESDELHRPAHVVDG